MSGQTAEDFIARPGEKVRPKLTALGRFLAGEGKLTVGGDLRRHQYADGQVIVGEDLSPVFRGAFPVSLTGTGTARVGEGLVNGLQPQISGVFLDGTNAEGQQVGEPSLALTTGGGGPNARLKSHLCLSVRVDAETGAMDPEAEDWPLTVEHLASLEGLRDGGWLDDGELTGFHPIAEITWADRRTPQRVRQIVFFDQMHRFIPGESGTGGTVGRHVFSPSA